MSRVLGRSLFSERGWARYCGDTEHVLSRRSPAERLLRKSIRFFTVRHPRHPPAFFCCFCTCGAFNIDLDKKLVVNSMFAIRFLFFFEADSIRKWSRANPAFVFGCVSTARRDRGLLLFGGHLMDLVVVWWSIAVTWGGSSGADCHLGIVLGHLMDLYVVWYVYLSYLVLSRPVSFRLVSPRLVLSCKRVFGGIGNVWFSTFSQI